MQQRNKLGFGDARGHGRFVAEAAMLGGLWQEIPFVDDIFVQPKTTGRWPIISDPAHLSSVVLAGDNAIVTIDDQPTRVLLFQ